MALRERKILLRALTRELVWLSREKRQTYVIFSARNLAQRANFSLKEEEAT
jgi:hypothetical protein